MNVSLKENHVHNIVFVYVVRIIKKIFKKFIMQNNWLIFVIQIIFMEYLHKFPREDVHVKSHNVKKNIVNVLVQGLNVQKIVSVVIVIMENLILNMNIIKVEGSRFK